MKRKAIRLFLKLADRFFPCDHSQEADRGGAPRVGESARRPLQPGLGEAVPPAYEAGRTAETPSNGRSYERRDV